ncbi:hypothetical protein B6I21_01070 [candidate division KSB1 bacterium 4572_119]|nr:MAG: hypothetical protein B6I21_01070 [candidate division KSB1 bacterium 4572_119]
MDLQNINQSKSLLEKQNLYSEQVRLLYANATGSMVASLINSLILAILLWQHISYNVLIPWLGCSFLITIIRFIIVNHYNNTPIKVEDAQSWGRWLIAGIAAIGLVWGSAGIFLFADKSAVHQVFLAFVIGGMVAGSLGAYSVVKTAFLLFCVPASVPIMIKFFLVGEDIHLAMGGMTLLFMLVMLVTAHRMNKTIVTSLKLQFNNFSLINSLTKTKKRTDKLNIKLKSEIVERKKVEKALIKARKQAEAANRSKSDFLANMSHEIRTPMNGVIAATGLLLDTELNEEQQEYAETVHNSADALLSLINDILDFSKIEAGKLTLEDIDFNLYSTLEEVSDMLAMRAQNKGLELICLIDPNIPSIVRGDPGRLRQIIINLVGNAIKFTTQGEIVIRVSLVKQNKEQTTLRFSVKDTGIGIDQKSINKLFDSFAQADTSTTRKFGGTGLGLTISKQLIEMMGGRIHVESELGKGSTFWFTAILKKQDGDIKEIVNKESLESSSLQDEPIIGVDDNETNRFVLESILNSWGCDFLVVADAHTAMEKMSEAVKKNKPFRIAILDYQMPEIDGATLGKMIKENKELSETALVLMTSKGQRGDLERFKKIGFSAYLTKPVKQSQMFDCLMTLISDDHVSTGEKKRIVTTHTIAEDRRSKIRLLLAEDNVVNQKLALKILEKMGYSADAVANGKEVITSLEKINYDIVLMDVQMPEMDGYEATRAIRSGKTNIINSSIPIIAMTAHAMKGDREKCITAGMDDYVTKPINPKKLSETIAKWIPANHFRPKKIDKENNGENNGDNSKVFDRNSLLEKLGGDEEFLNELVNTFIGDAADQIQLLGEAIKKKDAAQVEHLAHTLKGSSGNIGAAHLSESAKALEIKSKNGDFNNVAEILKTIEKEFLRLKKSINTRE